MATRFLFIVIIVTSCGRVSKDQNYSLKDDSTKLENDEGPSNGKLKTDSLDKKMFWDAVILPILKKDRMTVLDNMDFPVEGNWTQMLEMNKGTEEATRDDFAKVYNRFFNSDFIEELSKKDFSNTHKYIFNDTTWYSFELVKKIRESESSIALVFFKKGNQFKLKKIGGAGGNFYAK